MQCFLLQSRTCIRSIHLGIGNWMLFFRYIGFFVCNDRKPCVYSIMAIYIPWLGGLLALQIPYNMLRNYIRVWDQWYCDAWNGLDQSFFLWDDYYYYNNLIKAIYSILYLGLEYMYIYIYVFFMYLFVMYLFEENNICILILTVSGQKSVNGVNPFTSNLTPRTNQG